MSPSAQVPVRAAFADGVADWRDGVRSAAGLLVDLGTAGQDYVEACVQTVEEHGPYIVLTAGVALVHAQAAADSTREGLAVLRLGTAVEFGHATNDPVDVLLAFSSGGAHMDMIKALAGALGQGLADQLRQAHDEEGAERLLVTAVDGG